MSHFLYLYHIRLYLIARECQSLPQQLTKMTLQLFSSVQTYEMQQILDFYILILRCSYLLNAAKHV